MCISETEVSVKTPSFWRLRTQPQAEPNSLLNRTLVVSSYIKENILMVGHSDHWCLLRAAPKDRPLHNPTLSGRQARTIVVFSLFQIIIEDILIRIFLVSVALRALVLTPAPGVQVTFRIIFITNVKRLKGTVSQDFRLFLIKKNSICAPYEQAKTVAWNFSFLQRYSCKTCVRIVNDYADTVSA